MFLNRILQARIAKILQRSFVQTISEWVSRKRSQYYYRHIRMLAMLASSLMENCCSDLSDSVSTIHSNSYTRKIISFANKVETEMIIKLRLAYDSNTYSRSKRKKKYPVDRGDFNSHSARERRRRFVDHCEETHCGPRRLSRPIPLSISFHFRPSLT